MFFKLKNDIYKALEQARNAKVIGKSLEAEVILNVSEKYKDIIDDDFKQMLIVSKVTLSDKPLPQYQNCQVEIRRFDGVRCERCWAYFEKEAMQGDICKRCYQVIN